MSTSSGSTRVPVIVCGLGPIGQRIASRIAQSSSDVATIVGAVDLDPGRIGLSVGKVIGVDGLETMVASSASDALAGSGGRPGVVVHATGSRLVAVESQITEFVRQGWNVISTCEELSYPRGVDPEVSGRLDTAARESGASILGTGINPGFLMDALPAMLSLASTEVTGITVRRRVNTDERRIPLQMKVGVGMTTKQFADLATSREIGHVGLRQSAFLLADAMGWAVEAYDEEIVPVVTEAARETPLASVPAGGVIGQHQTATARCAEGHMIHYDLQMSAGAEGLDEIVISGTPTLHQRVEGGVNGDVGTEAVVANLVPAVYRARPGLLTMVDLLGIGRRLEPTV